jgi:hypothetical protein
MSPSSCEKMAAGDDARKGALQINLERPGLSCDDKRFAYFLVGAIDNLKKPPLAALR